MPSSIVYDAAVEGIGSGAIQFGADVFNVILVSGYIPDKAGHAFLSDITGEVSGSNYTAGGQAVDVTVDSIPDRVDIGLAGADWPDSTISATGAVYYDTNGDQLVCYVDFGSTVVSVAGLFSLAASTIQLHNPT